MYEGFYGLKEKPFSLLPDPAYLYLSEKHQMALSLLEYSLLNQAGFCVISGVTGAGKTTLIRHLLNQFGDNVAVGLLTNTHQSFDELLRWILMAFNLDYSADSKPHLYQTFADFLIRQYAENRSTVLIVDEAQNMSVATLEELRMLSNINADKDQVLQVILVGQPGLRDKLCRPDLEQFAQRIAVDYHLESLNREETRHYLRHRLAMAGGDAGLFEEEAVQSVYLHSNGIPRLINLLCESALVYGYAEGLPRISARLVEEVIQERQRHGLLPRLSSRPAPPNPPAPATANAVAVVEEVQDMERTLKVAGAKTAPVKLEASPSGNPPVTGCIGDSTDETVQVPTPPGNRARERRPAAPVGPVHLGPWPRSAVDAASANLHPPRSGAGPRVVGGVSVGQPSEGIAPLGERMSPSSVSLARPHRSQAAPAQAAGDNAAGGLITKLQEARRMAQDMDPSLSGGMGAGGTWMVATSLGFAAGLLVAVGLLVLLYFNGSTHLPASPKPLAGVAPPLSAGAAENSVLADQAMLEALQRERDAAVAQTRALERERDAALAAAKVRELTSAAELGAARARERERRAILEAAGARERARVAELEALAVRERERAVGQAVVNEAAGRPVVETKPVEAAAAPPAKPLIREGAAEESRPPVAPEPTVKFTANPCKGPSAKFLSTCKE